jgi:hypothetical protein
MEYILFWAMILILSMSSSRDNFLADTYFPKSSTVALGPT